MTEQQFTAHLKEKEQNLIIFGAGYYGTRMAKTCQKNGIIPVCFCDNNMARVGESVEGIVIRSFDDVKENFQNPVFLISPYEIEFQEVLVKQVEDAGFQTVEHYEIEYFFTHMVEVYFEQMFEPLELVNHKMQCYKMPDSPCTYIRHISISITHKCSLRCKDCAQFVPYHQNIEHYKKEDIMAYIDRMDEVFDFVTQLGILGGEPFLHPDVFEILEYAQAKESVHTILVTTNATILPKKEDLDRLDRKKLNFIISDYGDLSIKIKEFADLLEELQIQWIYSPRDQWLDCTKIAFRDKSHEALLSTYKECLHICPQLTDGKLFHCSNIGTAGHLLKAMPKEVVQYVDLMDTTKSIDELKKEVQYFFYGLERVEGCNWCTGRILSEYVYIEPAIQTKETLFFPKIYGDE